MITLITGAPGTGKSAACVSMLFELSKGRPVFVDGIPDLAVEHTPIDARQWPQAVPDGALVVIDEVQRVWRPTGPGSRIPEDIAALETHRHRGLDFIVITQHPKLVHSNVRNLVGRHVHLRDLGILGRYWYEWPEAGDPGSFRSAPVKKKYRLPKKVFGAYKSATEHIKPARSVPPALIVFAVAMVVLLVVLGRMVWRFSTDPDLAEPAAVQPGDIAPAPGRSFRSVSSPDTRGQVHSVITGTTLTVAMMPRLAHDPGSAPAYDHLRVVRVMPRIVGGFCEGDSCRCFTQQGTDPRVPAEVCREWIANPPFDPYREPQQLVAQPARSAGTDVSQSLTTAPAGL